MQPDSELQQLEKIRASGGLNPVQQSRYNELSQGGGGNPNDPLAMAKAIQQFQVQANQPAVQGLQQRQQDLPGQYASLLAEIKGSGTVATNQATTAENTLLGQRGITNDSPLYGQQMSQALLPVNHQYGQLTANLGQGSITDMNTLASNIASLKAGNPETSITGANALGGLQLQAQAMPAQIGLAQAQAGAQTAQGRYIPIPGVGVWDTQANKMLGGVSNNNLSSGGYSILNVGAAPR